MCKSSPLIILTGLPGSGKSTVAAALAATSDWTVVAKDALKAPLMGALPRHAALHSRALSDASFALLFALLPALLERSGVIVDGNFRSGEHEASLAPLCEARPVLQVLCRTPEHLRTARVQARAGTSSRDPHDALPPQLSYSAAADRFLALPGARIQLAGDAPLDDSLARIRSAAGAGGICV